MLVLIYKIIWSHNPEIIYVTVILDFLHHLYYKNTLRLAQLGGQTDRLSVIFPPFFTRREKNNPDFKMLYFYYFYYLADEQSPKEPVYISTMTHHCQKTSDFKNCKNI
jgi:hypothetical protein